ncbi:MAG TPA: hemolysin family protein [Syntrophales bacterium]|mgnify:FL=1|nr:hemolysin family protein [Syntrophales bacterium]HOS77877.1 hemolysin family protein [Syntrophales bacterium]
MDPLITLKLVLVGFLFLLSGFFSCSEAALFSLTPLHLHKMAEDRLPFLATVRTLTARPKRLLITIVVGNEIVNIAISVFMASIFLSLFPVDGAWMAVIVTTLLLLVFGETLPKTFGVVYTMSLSAFFSPLLNLFSRVEKPVVWALEAISERFVSLLTRGGESPRSALTEQEFRTLLDAGEREGAIESAQRDLIHRVFDLGDKPVVEVMVPRVDMFCLPQSLAPRDMLREVVAARHSRVPICGADRDDIVGILLAKDLLAGFRNGEPVTGIQQLLQKPFFIPEVRPAGSVLKDFQARRTQIAIVVDEYGGVSGLVTIEDILEDLFEDLYDEHGIGETLWRRVDEKTLVVSGKMPFDDLRELLTDLASDEEFETVGGFVFHLFGRLPAAGDAVVQAGRRFRVEKMGRARILRVRIETAETEADG